MELICAGYILEVFSYGYGAEEFIGYFKDFGENGTVYTDYNKSKAKMWKTYKGVSKAQSNYNECRRYPIVNKVTLSLSYEGHRFNIYKVM